MNQEFLLAEELLDHLETIQNMICETHTNFQRLIDTLSDIINTAENQIRNINALMLEIQLFIKQKGGEKWQK